MKVLKCLVIATLLSVPFVLDAQTLTNRQKRDMNMKLLDLVEKYEMYAAVYDKATVYSFIDLFASKDAEVYNDMLEFPASVPVSAEDYVKKLSERENVGVVVKNVSHGEYFYEGGAWHSIVTFGKSILYNDANGVLFSSEEFYGKDYSVSMDCVYDAARKRFVIASIDGEMVSDVAHLPQTFDVIERNTKNDDKLSVGGKPLKFNSFGQAFTPSGAVRPWNDDVRIRKTVSASTGNYELMKLDFKYTRFRAKARFSCSAGPAFKVSSPVEFGENKSFGYEAGVDLGFAFPLGRKMTMSVFTGLAYSSGSLSLSVGGYDYSYMTTSAGGHPYIRRYSIDRITEGVKYDDISVPLYLNFDHKLTADLLLSWNVGAKLYIHGKTSVVPHHVKASVSGDFSGGGIASQEDALGEIDKDFSAFLFPGSYGRNDFDMSLVAGLSLSYNVYNGLVFAYVKVNYEYGISEMYSSDNKPFYVEDEVFPLVYTSSGGGQNVAVRSLWECISYRRQAFWPELGVMFKF